MPLIDCLRTNDFVSGETIAQKLNVSRTTISEWITQLSTYGLTINRVKGRGYRLIEPLQLLKKETIEQSLREVLDQISVIDIAAETSSTNETASSSEYYDERWKLFTAEYQHSGRGRRGRQWVSPFGSNILFSLGKKSNWNNSTLYGASLIAGMSIAKTLQRFTVSAVQIKWPNDIYIQDSKVAGILCEMQGNPTDEALLVIGVGLNFFTSPELKEKATTSLVAHSIGEINRSTMVGQLATAVISSLNAFDGFNDSFMKEWAMLDYLSGKEVELHKGGDTFQGEAQGIDDRGQLKLLTPSNRILVFNGGEVSVRW